MSVQEVRVSLDTAGAGPRAQSMQNLKPAKEFRTLIANEESLDALLEIKRASWNITCRKNPAMTQRALAILGVMLLWAIWGSL